MEPFNLNMDYLIYAVGDSSFLEQVLIAVSMVINSAAFETMARIVALVAIIFIGFSSLNNNAKEFNIAPILTGIILFSFMYFPRVTAVIHDTVTDQVRVVDKVPLGMAAPASIISRIGHGIAETMEQGFAYVGPGLPHSRFAESLSIVANIRKNLATPQLYKAITEDSGDTIDFERSMRNYVAECAITYQKLRGIDGSEANHTDINSILEIKENINTYGTKIYMGPKDLTGSDVMCGQAYNTLNEALNNALKQGVKTAQVITVAGYGKPGLTSFGENLYPSEAKATVMQHINAVHGGAISATEYTKALINAALYQAGTRQHYIHYQDVNNHAMMVSAIEQRNTKWAAEQSMFLNTVRPLLAFFEAFIYAAFPFMLLLVLTGKIGINLISKYLLSVVWIQLWLPLLSIVNLFIHVSASRNIQSLPDQLNSMYGINSGYSIIQDWLAVGGMLAASVPLLSLFLISGSVYTMNSIAGRLSGSSHINEKVASPDVRDAKPMMATSTLMEGAPLSGVNLAGSKPFFGSFSMSNAIGSGIESAKAEAEKDSRAWSKALGDAWRMDDGRTVTGAYAESIGRSLATSHNEQDSSFYKAAHKRLTDMGVDSSKIHQTIGSVALAASVGADASTIGNIVSKALGRGENKSNTSVGQAQNANDSENEGKSPFSLGGNIKTDAADKTTMSASETLKLGQSFAEDTGLDKVNAATLMHSMASQGGHSSGTSFASQEAETATQNLSLQAQKAVSSDKSYRELSSLQSQFGFSQNIEGATLSKLLAQPQFASELNNIVNDYGLRDAANNNANRLTQLTGNPNRMQVGAMGALQAIANPNAYQSAISHASAINRLGQLMSQAVGGGVSISDPTRFQGVGAGAEVPGLVGEVDNAINNLPNRTSNLRGQVASGIVNAQNEANKQNAYEGVYYQYGENQNKVRDDNFGFRERIHEAKQAIKRDITSNKNDTTFAQNIMSALRSVGGLPLEMRDASLAFDENRAKNYTPGDSERVTTLMQHGLTQSQAEFYSSNFVGSSIDKNTAKNNVIREQIERGESSGFANTVKERLQEAAYIAPTGSAPASLQKIAALNRINDFQQRNAPGVIVNLQGTNPDENSVGNRNSGTGVSQGKNNSHPKTIDGIGGMGVLQGAALSNVVGSQYPISSRYGMRTLNGETRMHSGIDIATPPGTRIGSLADGVVSHIGYQADGYGYWVEVKHGNGLLTRYAHLQKGSIAVKPGDRVSAGQKLANSGNSGKSKAPHLHFETFKAVGDNLYSVNPVKVVNFTNKITSPPRASNDVNLRKKL